MGHDPRGVFQVHYGPANLTAAQEAVERVDGAVLLPISRQPPGETMVHLRADMSQMREVVRYLLGRVHWRFMRVEVRDIPH